MRKPLGEPHIGDEKGISGQVGSHHGVSRPLEAIDERQASFKLCSTVCIPTDVVAGFAVPKESEEPTEVPGAAHNQIDVRCHPVSEEVHCWRHLRFCVWARLSVETGAKGGAAAGHNTAIGWAHLLA
jgi:hypothetical protein